jgi:hypothetical protein
VEKTDNGIGQEKPQPEQELNVSTRRRIMLYTFLLVYFQPHNALLICGL